MAPQAGDGGAPYLQHSSGNRQTLCNFFRLLRQSSDLIDVTEAVGSCRSVCGVVIRMTLLTWKRVTWKRVRKYVHEQGRRRRNCWLNRRLKMLRQRSHYVSLSGLTLEERERQVLADIAAIKLGNRVAELEAKRLL